MRTTVALLWPSSWPLLFWFVLCANSDAAGFRRPQRRLFVTESQLQQTLRYRGGGDKITYTDRNPQLRYKYDVKYIKELDAYIDFLVGIYSSNNQKIVSDESIAQKFGDKEGMKVPLNRTTSEGHDEIDTRNQIRDVSRPEESVKNGSELHLFQEDDVTDSDYDLDQYVDFLLATTSAAPPSFTPTINSNQTQTTIYSNITASTDEIVIMVEPEETINESIQREMDDYIDPLVTAVELDEYIDRLVSSISTQELENEEEQDKEEDSKMDSYIETLVATHGDDSLAENKSSAVSSENKMKIDGLDEYVDLMVQTIPTEQTEVSEVDEDAVYDLDEAAEVSIATTGNSTFTNDPTITMVNATGKSSSLPTSQESAAGSDVEDTEKEAGALDSKKAVLGASEDSSGPSDHDNDDDGRKTDDRLDSGSQAEPTTLEISNSSSSMDTTPKAKVGLNENSEADGDTVSETIKARTSVGSTIPKSKKKKQPVKIHPKPDQDTSEKPHSEKTAITEPVKDTTIVGASESEAEAEGKAKKTKSKKRKRKKKHATVSQSEPASFVEEGKALSQAADAPENDEQVDTAPIRHPNGLYRFLLTKGFIGHFLCLAIVMLVEWIQVYIPQIADLAVLLWLKLAPARLQQRLASRVIDNDASLPASSLQQQYSGRMPVKGKQRKMLSKRADQEALAQLKRVGDIQDAKYKHVSLEFMKRHGLGPFCDDSNIENEAGYNNTEGLPDRSEITANKKRKRRKTSSQGEDDSGDSDVEWILQGLTKPKSKAAKASKSRLNTSVSLGAGSTGPSIGVGFEFDLGSGSKKPSTQRSTSSLNREALTKEAVRKKRSPRFSDRDGGSGVMGRLRAAATSNSVVSRSLLGAYPGDALQPSEAANAKGLTALAQKYGYGEWSSDDEDEGPETKKKQSRRKKRRITNGLRSEKSSDGDEFDFGGLFDGDTGPGSGKTRQKKHKTRGKSKRQSLGRNWDHEDDSPSLQELKGLESSFASQKRSDRRRDKIVHPPIGRLNEARRQQRKSLRRKTKKSTYDGPGNSSGKEWNSGMEKEWGKKSNVTVRPALQRLTEAREEFRKKAKTTKPEKDE